jgi:hypothetical protein
VYVALYGPKGSVIFDHPYNAEYERHRNCVASARVRAPIVRFGARGIAGRAVFIAADAEERRRSQSWMIENPRITAAEVTTCPGARSSADA